jgi:hypothetical protein
LGTLRAVVFLFAASVLETLRKVPRAGFAAAQDDRLTANF